MRHSAFPAVLPIRDGVGPSCVVLPGQGQGSILDFLAARLPGVDWNTWRLRMEAGEVVDERGDIVSPDRPFENGLRLFYYRSLPAEPVLPFNEEVLYQDDHLLVADKPHFMAVTPSGCYLHHTLLVRLRRRLALPQLSPLHRIDRETAGLVMFSVQQRTRGAYQALFRDRVITKHYEAVAPWMPDGPVVKERYSRIEESAQFFRMQEVLGPPNAHTAIELLQVKGCWARYGLAPTTGKRHQLRVHMAALGLPLRHDPLYPEVHDRLEGDFVNPLQLLARSLVFTDPVTGKDHRFYSARQLQPLD